LIDGPPLARLVIGHHTFHSCHQVTRPRPVGPGRRTAFFANVSANQDFDSDERVKPVIAQQHEKESSTMDWRHRSACLDEDPELFFPIGNTGPAILQIEEAKQVCRRCEVREQCLAWALEAGQDHGVWGGMSEDERRALKRRNARAKVRTA
jgi:WhiB family redox-sensing transcriptional regulator